MDAGDADGHLGGRVRQARRRPGVFGRFRRTLRLPDHPEPEDDTERYHVLNGKRMRRAREDIFERALPFTKVTMNLLMTSEPVEQYVGYC